MCKEKKILGEDLFNYIQEQAESFLRDANSQSNRNGTIEEGQKFGYISTFLNSTYSGSIVRNKNLSFIMN